MAGVVSMQPVIAQSSLVSQYGNTLDSVSNATSLTKYMTVKLPVLGYYPAYSVAFTAVKSTGTVSATATLQYSHDGVNYYSLTRDSVYTLTDVATQTFGWNQRDWGGPKWLRIKFVGTGTMFAKVSGTYSFVKP